MTVDVLVIGGGPTGLAAAIELGRRGIEVYLVDPRTELDYLNPRAKTVTARTMEHFRRWGIADRVRGAAALPVSYAQDVVFCTGLLGKEIRRFPEAFALTTDRRDDYAEAGQQMSQPVLERVLREVARELPTVTLSYGTRVSDLVDGTDEVSALLTEPDGLMHRLTARYALGCDGATGISRAAIGASYQGNSGAARNVNITFRCADLAPRTTAVHYWVVGARYGGLMGRLDLDGTWWTIVQGIDLHDVDPVDVVLTMLGERRDVEIVATDPWRTRMLLADRYRGQRVFLVGDAAHLNPPWGGHGMNTCIGDAVNIGWKVAAVLAGWGGAALLDSYELERRPVAERTLRTATDQEPYRATDFASPDLDDDGPVGERLRAALAERLAVKDGEFHSLGLVLGYDYPDSPVVVPDGGDVPAPRLSEYVPSAHAGARLPHAWLADGRSIYDVLDARFTVVRCANVPVPQGVPVVEAPQLRDHYRADLVLVRPDQHVAWRGTHLTTELCAHAAGLDQTACFAPS